MNVLTLQSKEVEVGKWEDVEADLSPDREIEEAIEEAQALDNMLQDLDSYYGTTEYTRLGCLSHKVQYI